VTPLGLNAYNGGVLALGYIRFTVEPSIDVTVALCIF
jgi:hypothetical protein